MFKIQKYLYVFLVVGLLLGALMVSCSRFKVTTFYENGAVATAAPIATEIGQQVFARGGNAFDVAVTVGFVLAVVHPQAGNIGGGGFALLREGETGRVRSLDFRETAPLAVSENMFLDTNGEVVPGLSTYGARAAGVPGTVAGLYELWKDHGSLSWEELVRIAADLADSGFVVDDYLAKNLKEYETELTGFEETAAIFSPGGRTLSAGDRLIQKDLGATLYIIASEGPDGFYSGLVAERIDNAMKRHGGLITLEDLDNYTAVWREPLRFMFDSLEIYSMAPPSSGGIAIGQILKLLELFDFSRFSSESPEYIHLFCEASRLAFADRSVHLGDPEFYRVPDNLLDKTYLAGRRENITIGHAANSQLVQPGNPYRLESEQTTHFSVGDRKGNMIAVTYTLNTSYGSKLVVAGAGFLLNNEMDDFSIKPGFPNTYGLIGAEANKIEPGKRMLSSMAPTLVLKNGEPFLILGSPGGSKIITTVAEAIVNFVRFGLSPEETAAFPRFHHQWLPDRILLEKGGFSTSIKQDLISYGHTVEDGEPFGDLQLIYIDPLGLMTAASDPRSRGTAAGY
ncbi:MAG: gamma-glutamyltransferase [Candidatus Zixiibacteriota bacterium]